ncbi:hypothetical protein [Priestia megaterium]|nr:hypothetical protein [Priestia megaterium]
MESTGFYHNGRLDGGLAQLVVLLFGYVSKQLLRIYGDDDK